MDEPPAKRARLLAPPTPPSPASSTAVNRDEEKSPLRVPSIASTSPFRVVGNAAFHVFTNRQLFRLLPQWMDGWPGQILTHWRPFSTATNAADALRVQRGFATSFITSKARKLELFMRERMLAGDIKTLRLAGECRWHDGSETRRFPVKDLQFAIRSGHVETVRWAFEFVRDAHLVKPLSSAKMVWFWTEAMDHFPGHSGVIDVLCEFLSPPVDVWIHQNTKVPVLESAQWFVAHMGAAFLTPSTILLAAASQELPLVKYLATVPGQEVDVAVADAESFKAEICEFLQSLAPKAEERASSIS